MHGYHQISCVQIIYNGVDLTTLGEHKQPQKYARKLLLQLFSVEELACGTYKKLGHTSRSELDSERVAILEGKLVYST